MAIAVPHATLPAAGSSTQLGNPRRILHFCGKGAEHGSGDQVPFQAGRCQDTSSSTSLPLERHLQSIAGWRTCAARVVHTRSSEADKQSANSSNILSKYDILSCQPTNEKALQLACLDFSNPGPNQLSIITLPLHERPYHFRLNRKQINQAQRNGVVVSLPRSPTTSLLLSLRVHQDVSSR